MSNVDVSKKRTGVTGFMSKVLNESGTAIVNIFDGVAYVCTGVKDGVKKTPEVTRKVSKKAKSLVSTGVEKIKPLPKKTFKKVKRVESKQLQEKIKKREKKIASLYYEIGKEGSKVSDQSNILEQEPIKKLIADAKGYEREIQRLKDRITELESVTETEKTEKVKLKVKPVQEAPAKKRDEEKIARARAARAKIEKEKETQKAVVSSQTIKQKNIQAAINVALKTGTFKTPSERAKFETVSKDLMDSEIEIRMLAAAELSKMGNTASVPVLIEIAKETDPYLITETLNSLINIGDKRAISTFKQKIDDDHYRVRIASLRGLYKLSDNDDDLKSILIKSIRDEHPEVRKSAVTFIGWKDYAEAVPPLVQCLADEDERVKKSAISALANIRDRASVMPLIKLLSDGNLEIREKALSAIQMIVGEEISFDIQQSNDDLAKSVKDLKEWWQQKRIHGAKEDDIDPLEGLGVPKLSTEKASETPPQEVIAKEQDKSAQKKSETTTKVAEDIQKVDDKKKGDDTKKKSEDSSKSVDSGKSDLKAQSKDSSSADKKETSDAKSSSVDQQKKDISEQKADDKNKVMTKDELKQMPKVDLITMGKDMGLNSSEIQTKSSIIRNILDQQKKQ